jgi:hypothetical protein
LIVAIPPKQWVPPPPNNRGEATVTVARKRMPSSFMMSIAFGEQLISRGPRDLNNSRREEIVMLNLKLFEIRTDNRNLYVLHVP